MLDNATVDNDLTNEDSYDSLVAVIEASQGMLALLIASCEPGSFENQLIERYETELAPKIPSYRVTLDRSEPSLRAALEKLVETNPLLKQPQALAVITVTGAAELLTIKLRETEEKSELDRFFGYLQWTREGLRAFPYPIVLWVTPKILLRLSFAAPDFWSWRSGVFRFVAPVVEATTTTSSSSEIEEISPMLESEPSSDLPLDELKEQIAQIQKQNDLSPALATLYDRVGQAYTNRIMSGKSEDLELEIEQAIDYFQRAINLQTTLNLQADRGSTLIRLGNLYDDLGHYQEAKLAYEQSLAITREIGDRRGEANSLNNLGNAYKSLGKYSEAIEFYQQSLAIKRDIGDQRGEANSLIGLGNVYKSLEEYQKAIEFYQQSLAIKREIGDRGGEANSYNNLGNVYYSLGEYQKAIEFYQQSLAITGEIGDRGGEAKSYNNLGIVYNSLGEYQKAIEFHQQSLAIKREIGDRGGEANSYGNLGNVYKSLGEYQKAIEFYEQSLAITRGIGNRKGEANSLYNLGLSLKKVQREADAIGAFRNARQLYQAIGLDSTVQNCDNQIISLSSPVSPPPQWNWWDKLKQRFRSLWR